MLHLKIYTDNAAFEEYGTVEECARLLEEAASKIKLGNTEFPLHDMNGNPVGKVKMTNR